MLEIDDRSQTFIEFSIDKLRQSSAVSKIAFSSYTHAAFDQETRIIVGDIRWRRFATQAKQLNCSLFPLVWEMQPPGALNDITLLLPTRTKILKTRIKSGLSAMSWWCKIDEQIAGKIQTTILGKDRWKTTRDFFKKNLIECYQTKINEEVLARVDQLKSVYEQTFCLSEGLRLSEISESIYQKLVRLIFGDIAMEFLTNRQSYFGSEFSDQMAKKAVMGLKDRQLVRLLRSLPIASRPIFVGGQWGSPFVVTFDRHSESFIKRIVDPRSGVAEQYGTKTEIAQLADLLEASIVRPTGKLFDVLLMLEEDELIIHDGNDYGGPKQARAILEALDMGKANVTQYLQLFPDNEDSFPPIQFGGIVGVTPSLATLFIWNIDSEFWLSKLVKAVKSGKPVQVDLYKEVRNVG